MMKWLFKWLFWSTAIVLSTIAFAVYFMVPIYTRTQTIAVRSVQGADYTVSVYEGKDGVFLDSVPKQALYPGERDCFFYSNKRNMLWLLNGSDYARFLCYAVKAKRGQLGIVLDGKDSKVSRFDGKPEKVNGKLRLHLMIVKPGNDSTTVDIP